MSKTIAFVFARGGSKGLPGKNIKPLCNKPLIQYSIDCAQTSELIDDIYVSTDDVDIAHVARKGGAKVIDRPKELATDDSPEWLSWQHAITWVTQHTGAFETFVSLPATTDFVLSAKGLFDGKATAIEVPRERAVDIDDIIDFKFAELLMTEQT